MNNIKKISVELVLPFILTWFFMTVLVDIVTIPTVFRNSTSIIDAGKIGMIVFGRFNIFEIIFSLIILLGAIVNFFVLKKSKWLYFSLPLVVLSFVYKFYMTPMITNLSNAIHKTQIADPMFAVLQSQHAEYHTLYRQFDSSKLLFLLVFAGVVLFDRVKGNKEIK